MRDGKFFTVGDNGPEMFPIKRGDIVFNHEQSKELLRNGHTSGRGKAYADGTLRTANSHTNHMPEQIYREMPLWERMEKCAAALGRTMDDMLNPLNSIALDIRKETGAGRLLESINNVNNNITNNNRNVQQPVTIQIGDINLTGVQDVNGLAQAIKTRLPGKMMQEYFKN